MRFLQWVSLALVCVGGSVDGEERPNLLVISTDEHHYNTLGCYGGTIVETPHIDWLAENGARCDRFYATTPVCSPSRAALVTGLYPQHTDVVQNNIPLRDDLETFASFLGDRGYATGYAGKWHLDGTGKPQWEPERRFGFDDNRYMFNRGHWKRFEDGPDGPRVASRNSDGAPNYAVGDADETSFSTDWLTGKAIDFIRQQSGPFCYMLSLPDPHGPNTVRAPYNTKYVGVDVPIPVSLRKSDAQTPGWARREGNISPRWLRANMPQYYGMVALIDENVGRLLAALREEGKLDNTVVVFTSDHGDLCGEHGRANKGNPYEGSARIPFLIYAADRVAKGRVVDEALGCVDFMPTVLSLMGFEPPSGVQGRDASALFAGQTPSDWDDFTVLRSTTGQAWIAAVTSRYKLVFSKQDSPWLFDREADALELDNRFERPELGSVAARLSQKLLEYGDSIGDPWLDEPALRAQVLQTIEKR